MQPAKNVFAAFSDIEKLAKFCPCKNSARGTNINFFIGFQSKWSQFVKGNIKLVGNITKIPAAAGSAPVIHIEAGYKPVTINLYCFCILSSDIKYSPRSGENCM